MVVNIKNYVHADIEALRIHERVYYPVLKELMEEYTNEEELVEQIGRNMHRLIPKHITKEDIFASMNYNIHVEYGVGNVDDIDHLGNRRIRAVGELLQNQFRIGCLEWSVLFVNE